MRDCSEDSSDVVSPRQGMMGDRGGEAGTAAGQGRQQAGCWARVRAQPPQYTPIYYRATTKLRKIIRKNDEVNKNDKLVELELGASKLAEELRIDAHKGQASYACGAATVNRPKLLTKFVIVHRFHCIYDSVPHLLALLLHLGGIVSVS